VKLLITGSTGFVGRALLARMQACPELHIRTALRRGALEVPGNTCDSVIVGDLHATTDWRQALYGIDTVVHLAARVHIMQESDPNPLQAFRESNVQTSLNLARMAVQAGVKRFIFMSSVKVNGETTPNGQPFTETSAPVPHEPYAISKFEAEQGLQVLGKSSGMEITILRPPLVYGPGVKANFANLARAVASGKLLPLGSIHNHRSLVALDNLTDLITICATHPAAGNQTFMVSDGEDLSTTALVRRMAQAMERNARLLPIPVWALSAGATLMGKRAAVQRLCANLQVDSSKARTLLGWVPPLGVDEGLRRALEEYR
jgi:nucleoside-diphosphate-sugar epimerase